MGVMPGKGQIRAVSLPPTHTMRICQEYGYWSLPNTHHMRIWQERGLRAGRTVGRQIWTKRTIRRYWLFAPTQVWSVRLGRDWAANAKPPLVGVVTFHQISL